MTCQLFQLSESPPSLEEAQKLVGGYVELIKLPDGSQLFVDEDGRSKGLDLNPLATALYGQRIIGPALHLTGDARWTK